MVVGIAMDGWMGGWCIVRQIQCGLIYELFMHCSGAAYSSIMVVGIAMDGWMGGCIV